MPSHVEHNPVKRRKSPRPQGSKHPSQRTSKPVDAANRVSDRPEAGVDGGSVPVWFRKGVEDY